MNICIYSCSLWICTLPLLWIWVSFSCYFLSLPRKLTQYGLSLFMPFAIASSYVHLAKYRFLLCHAKFSSFGRFHVETICDRNICLKIFSWNTWSEHCPHCISTKCFLYILTTASTAVDYFFCMKLFTNSSIFVFTCVLKWFSIWLLSFLTLLCCEESSVISRTVVGTISLVPSMVKFWFVFALFPQQFCPYVPSSVCKFVVRSLLSCCLGSNSLVHRTLCSGCAFFYTIASS